MMLTTLLLVLKIIGLTLLVILSILLFIILILLFVPVRYRALGVKDREAGSPVRASAGASWFLRAVSAVYEYNEKGRGLTVRIFGIRLKSREEKEERRRIKEKRKAERRNKKKKKDTGQSKTRVEYTMTEYDDSGDVFREREVDLRGTPKPDTPVCPPRAVNVSPGEDKEKESIFSKIASKLAGVYDKISGVLKGIAAKAEEADYYINALSNDASNRQAVSLIIKKTKVLIKSIRPRKLKGHVDYGSDDPADTGRVLAASAVAYPLYSPGLKINPDFEDKVFAFDVSLKGRIYLFVLVKTFIALYFNKRVKRLIKIMKKENDNGR